MTNADMITQQLEAMNAERERAAQSEIRSTINTIIGLNAEAARIAKALAEAKAKLTSISFTPIAATEVLG